MRRIGIKNEDCYLYKIPCNAGFFVLKQFQLLAGSIDLLYLFTTKQLYVSELFVCDAYYSYLPVLRQKRFDPIFVYLGIFATHTMAHVYGELEHGKSVSLKIFTKIYVGFLFPFGFCG